MTAHNTSGQYNAAPSVQLLSRCAHCGQYSPLQIVARSTDGRLWTPEASNVIAASVTGTRPVQIVDGEVRYL